MGSKNNVNTKQVSAPAPAAAPAASETPAADQNLTPEQQQTSAEPAAPTTPSLEGATGGVVASASAKVGVVSTPAQVQATAEAKAAVLKKGIWSENISALLERLKDNKMAVAAFAELENYLVQMAPGKQMEWEQGARYQVSLYRTLQLIINQIDKDFELVFGTLLATYHEFGMGRGALGPQHLFRFTGMINMSADDIKGFHKVNHLLLMLADPEQRAQNIKHVDFNAQLAHGLSDDGRRRVLSFFKR